MLAALTSPASVASRSVPLRAQEKIDKAMAESVGVIYILSMPSWLQPLFTLMKKVMTL